MRRTNSIGTRAVVTPGDRPAASASAWHSVEQLFAGPRPVSMRRGLEPAFLLFDRELLDRLQVAADDLGVHRNILVQRIAREHLDEY
jgi:hypothetical protein